MKKILSCSDYCKYEREQLSSRVCSTCYVPSTGEWINYKRMNSIPYGDTIHFKIGRYWWVVGFTNSEARHNNE